MNRYGQLDRHVPDPLTGDSDCGNGCGNGTGDSKDGNCRGGGYSTGYRNGFTSSHCDDGYIHGGGESPWKVVPLSSIDIDDWICWDTEQTLIVS